jgi:hypothetical protein
MRILDSGPHQINVDPKHYFTFLYRRFPLLMLKFNTGNVKNLMFLTVYSNRRIRHSGMKTVFRIRDVLIRIRSLHWIADPDPTLLSAAFQMKTKNKFFCCLLLTTGKFTSVLKDNPIHWIENPDPSLFASRQRLQFTK